MSSSQEKRPEPRTATEIFAEGWRLTKAIFALKGMEIPYTIPIQVTGENHVQETRIATLEDLANAVLSLDELIAHPSDRGPSQSPLYGDHETERLTKQRDTLVELQKWVSGCEYPSSTSVIEALFPNVPVKKRAPGELERWRAIRKEEGLKIDPETAEVSCWYARTFDPYGALDEWEMWEQISDDVSREGFARAPGNGIWVHFDDLPKETRDKLYEKYRPKLPPPDVLACLTGYEAEVLRYLSDKISASSDDEIPF